MHELSVMTNILDIVLDFAKKNNANRITKINLTVGEMTDLLPEWMQSYFDYLSKNTIAENAELIIQKIPAVIQCKNCKHKFTVTRENLNFACEKCQSTDIDLLSGREFRVESIEIN